MNYIKQLKEFYNTITTEPIPPNAKNLYETLLHINSASYWRKEFSVANTYLILLTGLNISSLQRARNTLVQLGYIKYKKGIGNNAGTYIIKEFVVQNDTDNEQQTDSKVNNKPTTDRTTNRQQTEHINKQNKTKLKRYIKKEKDKKEKNDLTKIYNSVCTSLPQIKKVTDKRKTAINKFLKEFSVNDFKQICSKANSSDFLTGINERRLES